MKKKIIYGWVCKDNKLKDLFHYPNCKNSSLTIDHLIYKYCRYRGWSKKIKITIEELPKKEIERSNEGISSQKRNG